MKSLIFCAVLDYLLVFLSFFERSGKLVRVDFARVRAGKFILVIECKCGKK